MQRDLRPRNRNRAPAPAIPQIPRRGRGNGRRRNRQNVRNQRAEPVPEQVDGNEEQIVEEEGMDNGINEDLGNRG